VTHITELTCHFQDPFSLFVALKFREGIKPGTERNGTGSNLALIFHAAAPAKMRASELIYMQGNFGTRDSTKQRKNAYEGAEQAVTIQYNTAWVPMIPQPKQFCYHGHSTYSTVETLTISSLASQARTHRRGDYFVQHAATIRVRRLIESSV